MDSKRTPAALPRNAVGGHPVLRRPGRLPRLHGALRWPDGVASARPAAARTCASSPRARLWECKSKHAKRQFSASRSGPSSRTRRIGLDKWLAGDLADRQLQERHLAPTRCTARSASRRRPRGSCSTASASPCRLAPSTSLAGEVEVDETFIGGKARNMHEGQRAATASPGTAAVGKAAVMGLLGAPRPRRSQPGRAQVVPSDQRADARARGPRERRARAPKSSPMRCVLQRPGRRVRPRRHRPRRELRSTATSTPTAWRTSGAC